MTKYVPFTVLAAAALLSGGAAVAATAPAKQTHVAAVTTRTTVKKTATVARPAASRLVTAKTSTGKTVTYDCSKAGNATKAACKS